MNKRIKNEKSNNKKEIHKNNGGIQYGNQKTYGSGNNEYPNLYAKENGSGINTETVKTDGIDANADWYSSPTTEDSSTANEGLTVTQTYYYFSNTPVNGQQKEKRKIHNKKKKSVTAFK